MKNCQRLDNVATNMIPFEEKTAKLLKENKKKIKVTSTNLGKSLSKKLGSNWKVHANTCEISSESTGIKTYVRVGKNSKTNEFTYSISFDTSELNEKSFNNIDTLKQSISNSLIDLVKSIADCGNKLG